MILEHLVFYLNESGFLRITPRGEKALHGISRKIYEKRFLPEMLSDFFTPETPHIPTAKRKTNTIIIFSSGLGVYEYEQNHAPC